ncbi:MAG: hypothetical protein D6722_25025 [Bacteroidetes bacterium]|nr:MAG: hypothetical protein D6722_25025 [Bacteroidota bacterium]
MRADLLLADKEPMEAVVARRKAKEADVARDEAYSNLLTGDFTPLAIADLADSVNPILELIGAPPLELEPGGDQVPPDLAGAVAMIMKMASDAGLDRLVMDPTQVKDDDGLTMLAGTIDALARNDSFRAFIRSQAEPGAKPLHPPPEKEETAQVGAEDDDLMDFDRLALGRIG